MKPKRSRYTVIAPRFAVCLLGCLSAAAFSLVLLIVPAKGRAAPSRESRVVVPCGPRDARSLAQLGGIRIFEASGSGLTRACSRSSGTSPRLGGHAMGGPFAIGSPWAGGIERRLLGVDTVGVSVAGVDVFTSDATHCLIGGADRPGQLPRVGGLWAVGEGRFVFSATLKLEAVGPEIVLCERDGSVNVLAQGSGIELGSITVDGTLVRWTQEGSRKSVRL
jgi:hypothetical protein